MASFQPKTLKQNKKYDMLDYKVVCPFSFIVFSISALFRFSHVWMCELTRLLSKQYNATVVALLSCHVKKIFFRRSSTNTKISLKSNRKQLPTPKYFVLYNIVAIKPWARVWRLASHLARRKNGKQRRSIFQNKPSGFV